MAGKTRQVGKALQLDFGKWFYPFLPCDMIFNIANYKFDREINT